MTTLMKSLTENDDGGGDDAAAVNALDQQSQTCMRTRKREILFLFFSV